MRSEHFVNNRIAHCSQLTAHSSNKKDMTKEELKEFRPWYAKSKKTITINLDNSVIAYFKELSEETGISYQNLINMFLLQCAKEKKKPVFA